MFPPQCEPNIDRIWENTGLSGLVTWFDGCLVGYQCKTRIDNIWGKLLVAWYICCWWAIHPFLFIILPLVGVLVGSACLAYYFLDLVCLVVLLAWPRCCLVGWHFIDGYMDGWVLCKWEIRNVSPAMQSKPPPHGISSIYRTWGKHGIMWLGCLFVGCLVGRWFGRVVAGAGTSGGK